MKTLLVFVASGLLGFRVGWVGFPDWQVAVETAQVVAGVVHYPVPTPFYVYHTKVWTILHQLLAVGLRAGASEIQLSLFVSGLLGMLSFQALALFVYTLSRDTLLAVGSAFLVLFSRSSEFGVAYPIHLLGTSDTYGVVGLSLCVLVAGLLGTGCNRSAAFLAGVAPAVHPSLGLWLIIILVICVAWDRDSLTLRFDPAWKYFLAGCGVTAISLLVQVTMISDAPPIDATVARTYLTTFVQLWDGHRRPVATGAAGVMLNGWALALALVWLTICSTELTRSAAFLLRVVIVAAVLSFVLVLASWIPPEWLPQTLLILMPTRLLNFNAMIAVALVLGLAGANRRSAWSPLLLLLISGGLLLGTRSMRWDWLQRMTGGRSVDTFLMLEVASAGLIVLGAARWMGRVRANTTLSSATEAGRTMLFGILLLPAILTWRMSASPAVVFSDRLADPLFKVASQERDGLLLTAANLHLMQLRTARPVLVDGGGFDGLPYALEAAPETERVLRDVYGIDFFHPPAEARGAGMIPRGPNRVTWEQFSPEKWRSIKGTYHVTQVLTWADWTLDLPVIAQNRELRLYSIPD